ncbi:hypothetical protein [Arthrobacter sp. SDTb3-6]|uniref:hypothetical protein n=1 Tax=Arthrobacter sp. SDTb3-6 TaxID=2713571 RepID=UPI00159D22F5|nr:hypothetical protein [Arthrobacter sp. SDTb3-6]
MHSLILLAATPAPSPTVPALTKDFTYDTTGPGFLGFLAMAFIVAIMFFLIRDMVKRIRRVRYRAQVAEAAMDGPHGPAAEHLGIPIMTNDAARAAGAKRTDTLAGDAPDAPKPEADQDQD